MLGIHFQFNLILNYINGQSRTALWAKDCDILVWLQSIELNLYVLDKNLLKIDTILKWWKLYHF